MAEHAEHANHADHADHADQATQARPARDWGRWLAAVLGVGGLALGFLVAGAGGVLVWLTVVATVCCVAALTAVPAFDERRPRRSKAATHENAPFRTYRLVAERLSWAEASPRHYDVTTRPMLAALLAARLAERHGVDLRRTPDRARELVGDELWFWLDPLRPARTSSDPPGIPPATLRLIVDRLELL